MKDTKKQEFILLFLIIVLSLAMGVYFGNKVVVNEGFGGIDKIKEGLSKANTVDDVKREYMRVINRAKKTKKPMQEELDDICLAHIARFKRPKEFKFVDMLPKNNYGKVLKTSLRDMLEKETPHA